MSTDGSTEETDLVHCVECGAEIDRSAEICTECGVRQGSSGHTDQSSEETDLVHCVECGAEIGRSAEICTECGVRQKNSQSVPRHDSAEPTQSGDIEEPRTTAEETNYLEHYSALQWIVSIILVPVTLIGIVIPIYLFYKARKGTGKDQSGWESWAAILFGLIGIVAVELGGETAAKALWGLLAVTIVLVGVVSVV
jgi:ribosomal protein L40E